MRIFSYSVGSLCILETISFELQKFLILLQFLVDEELRCQYEGCGTALLSDRALQAGRREEEEELWVRP